MPPPPCFPDSIKFCCRGATSLFLFAFRGTWSQPPASRGRREMNVKVRKQYLTNGFKPFIHCTVSAVLLLPTRGYMATCGAIQYWMENMASLGCASQTTLSSIHCIKQKAVDFIFYVISYVYFFWFRGADKMTLYWQEDQSWCWSDDHSGSLWSIPAFFSWLQGEKLKRLFLW